MYNSIKIEPPGIYQTCAQVNDSTSKTFLFTWKWNWRQEKKIVKSTHSRERERWSMMTSPMSREREGVVTWSTSWATATFTILAAVGGSSGANHLLRSLSFPSTEKSTQPTSAPLAAPICKSHANDLDINCQKWFFKRKIADIVWQLF